MIGIFDSGSGGLSVLKAMRQVMPRADVVYFGDIKNAPYGLKTQEELSLLTEHAISLLHGEKADHIVSACNSVAASLVISLSDRIAFTPSDIIEMVGPTVAHFRDSHKKLALCATPATIDSSIYQNAFQLIGQEVQYIAIKDLAGAIESGASNTEIQQIIRAAFSEREGFDTLILACTHYPLVRQAFEQALPGVDIFDPSMVVAERVRDAFPTEIEGVGTTKFIISQDSHHFCRFVDTVIGEPNPIIEVRST
jgi:glutamate racemase